MSRGAYQRFLRPALFRLGGGDPEAAHEQTLRMLARLPRIAGRRPYSPAGAARTVFGVKFPNPVGLAAGMDKDGRALPIWPALGFGFVEVGTVTWHPQPGNDRPRLFRVPGSEAIINRMGFNNAGAVALAERLRAAGPLPVPLGISIGKSAVTPLDAAVDDYVRSLRVLHPFADYIAVNVSSPNTPGLRTLQASAELTELLTALCAENAALGGETAERGGAGSKPMLVKVSPDLTDGALGDLIDVCLRHEVAGLIATNTTLDRSGLSPAGSAGLSPAGSAAAGSLGAGAFGAGGLSGRPLAQRAVEVVRFLAKESGLPVIGVGGIMRPDDGVRLVDAGADLVQLYTGLIYRGPALVRQTARAIGGRT